MDPSRQCWDMLYSACEEGDLILIKKMCCRIVETEKGVDFDDERWDKILKHVQSIGQKPVLQFMEGMKTCSGKGDWDLALYQAITKGETDIVEVMVESGLADVNGGVLGGVTPIYMACERGTMDIIQCLAKERADLHALHRQDMTALHIAAQTGNMEMATCLVRNGANVNMRAHVSNWTPLHKACYYKHTDVAQYLIEKEAKVNLKDINGNTALFISCDKGLDHTVSSLLEHGADVNLKNNKGQMPLHIACIRGYHVIVLSLLDNGTDPRVPQKDGQTPLYIACLASHYYSDKCDLALADRQSSLSISSIQKCFAHDGCIISMLLYHGASAYHWCRPWHDFIPKKDLVALEILLEHKTSLIESSLLDFFHHEPLILLIRAGWAESWCLRLLIRKAMNFGDATFIKFAVNVDPMFLHKYPIFEHISDLQGSGDNNSSAWTLILDEKHSVPSLQGLTTACIRKFLWRGDWWLLHTAVHLDTATAIQTQDEAAHGGVHTGHTSIVCTYNASIVCTYAGIVCIYHASVVCTYPASKVFKYHAIIVFIYHVCIIKMMLAESGLSSCYLFEIYCNALLIYIMDDASYSLLFLKNV